MTDAKTTPIIAFVAVTQSLDLIDAAATAAGYRMITFPSAAVLEGNNADGGREPPGEMLYGRDGQLFQKVVAWQPALLIFDLSNRDIPWFRWLPGLKSSPATRRIPVLAFAPATAAAEVEKAQKRGADASLPQTEFMARLPELLQAYAQRPDQVVLQATCNQPLASLALSGIELFNQGEYYRCHDDLEEAWQQDPSPGRELYRGILQYGIALYQIERGNYRGAVKMLLRVRQWLAPLPEQCRGVQVDDILQNIDEVATAVKALGPDSLTEFDFAMVAKIQVQR